MQSHRRPGGSQPANPFTPAILIAAERELEPEVETKKPGVMISPGYYARLVIAAKSRVRFG
jgi:hypothetical protein